MLEFEERDVAQLLAEPTGACYDVIAELQGRKQVDKVGVVPGYTRPDREASCLAGAAVETQQHRSASRHARLVVDTACALM